MTLEPLGRAKRVTIVLRTGNVHHRTYLNVLEELRRLGASGATAFQGHASFVDQHEIRSSRFAVDYIPDLPVMILWIDRDEVVDRVLPQILPMIEDGLVTVDETEVVHSASTEVSDLPRQETVKEVMTADVVSVRMETPVAEIVADLVERRFRAVPVIDEQRHVVGIITNTDLVERGGLTVHLDLLQTIDKAQRQSILQDLAGAARTAADVMTPKPLTVNADTTVRHTADIMLQRQLDILPVTDSDGKLVGIVSRVDLLRTVTIGVDRPKRTDGSDREQASAPVTRVMTKDVPVVAPDDALPSLMNVIVSTRLHRAVVVDGDRRPLGVVSDAEVIERVTPEARPGLLMAIMRRLPLLHGSEETQAALQRARGRVAKDFMRQDFVSVESERTIAQALEALLTAEQKAALVVDVEGRLVGMVDRRDLLGALI
jgi:CBS-domain-containing membrane protein